MNIGILEPDNFSEFSLNQLKQIGNVSFLNNENIEDFISDKQIVYARLKYFLGENLLKFAPYLKYICSPTTGLNHFDIEYCKNNNIEIISLKGETDFLKNIKATPEHTLGLIIALYRKYPLAFQNQNQRNWNRELFRGQEINNSRIGFIGFGRVAKLVSQYLSAMGAQIGYYDIDESILSEKNEKQFSNDLELVSWSDCVVLTASYIAENGVIITSELIDAMMGKYFVNTARAELTNEKYLIEKIKQDYFKGIALDVITAEQADNNNLNDLIKVSIGKNVIITPHIGGATFDSMRKTEDFITDKLLKILSFLK
jgi:D-3-phosphoglycerate dehydrogenase / 2-oxoglutarate reductase